MPQLGPPRDLDAHGLVADRVERQLEVDYAALAALAARAVLAQNGEHVGVLRKDLGHQCLQALPQRAPRKLGQETPATP